MKVLVADISGINHTDIAFQQESPSDGPYCTSLLQVLMGILGSYAVSLKVIINVMH